MMTSRHDLQTNTEKLDILREMWTAGASNPDIATRIGINRKTVTVWATQLGLPPKRAESAAVRSQDKDDELRQMRKDGLSILEIMRATRASKRAVVERLHELGLSNRRPISESPWNKETDAQLVALRNEGLTDLQIADRMGLNENQVTGRRHRLTVPGRVEQNPYWPKRDPELIECVAGGLSLVEISNRMDIPKNSIVYRMNALNIGGIKPGDLFGESKVLSEILPRPGRDRMWLVACPCGSERPVVEKNLRKGGCTVCRACSSRIKLQNLNAKRPRIEGVAVKRKAKTKTKPKIARPVHTRPVAVPQNRQDAPIVRVPEPPPPAFEERVRTIGTDGCRFPFGTPRTASFRFCGEKPVRGRPYCEACLSRAYVTLVREAA